MHVQSSCFQATSNFCVTMTQETDGSQFGQLMQAIANSHEQMEAKFSKLREDMSASQEQATQEVIKTFKQQNEYSFKKKGNDIQYQFNAAVDVSLQVAKKELSKLQLKILKINSKDICYKQSI